MIKKLCILVVTIIIGFCFVSCNISAPANDEPIIEIKFDEAKSTVDDINGQFSDAFNEDGTLKNGAAVGLIKGMQGLQSTIKIGSGNSTSTTYYNDESAFYLGTSLQSDTAMISDIPNYLVDLYGQRNGDTYNVALSTAIDSSSIDPQLANLRVKGTLPSDSLTLVAYVMQQYTKSTMAELLKVIASVEAGGAASGTEQGDIRIYTVEWTDEGDEGITIKIEYTVIANSLTTLAVNLSSPQQSVSATFEFLYAMPLFAVMPDTSGDEWQNLDSVKEITIEDIVKLLMPRQVGTDR